MPRVDMKQFTIAPPVALHQFVAGLPSLPFSDEGATHPTDVEETKALLRLARQHGRTVRMVIDEFNLQVLWAWLGHQTGLALLHMGGRFIQANLMVTAEGKAEHPAALRLLHQLIPELFDATGLAESADAGLLTFTTTPTAEDGGAFLFGFILNAAFCEVCDVPDSTSANAAAEGKEQRHE